MAMTRWRNLGEIKKNAAKYISNSKYDFCKSNGQRITSANSACKVQPPKGSEVFVGRIPKDMFEDELLPIFEKIGLVFKMRLMMSHSEYNRGYAFVTFFSVQNASAAVRLLHGFQVRKGNPIAVYISTDNCRLFIGRIPKDVPLAEVKSFLEGLWPEIVNVIIYPSRNDKGLNRGFAFLDFANHHTASKVRKYLNQGSLVAWDVPLFVDWAETLPYVDPLVMAQVKTLFVRNVDYKMPSEVFYNTVAQFVIPNSITKIHKTKDYAFINFTDRKAAEKGLKILKDMIINGKRIDVQWAHPKEYCQMHLHMMIHNYSTSLPSYIRKLKHDMNPKRTLPRSPYSPIAIPALLSCRELRSQRNNMENISPENLPNITYPSNVAVSYQQRSNMMIPIPNQMGYYDPTQPIGYFMPHEGQLHQMLPSN